MIILPASGTFMQNISASVILPVILTVVFYSVYWLIAISGRIKDWLSRGFLPGMAGILHIVVKRVAGFLILGVVPVLICLLIVDGYTLADAGLVFSTENSGFTVISIMILSLLIIPVVSFSARKPSIIAVYPEIRASQWTGSLMVVEAATWALYLLGYETLFRGVLLFGVAGSAGPVTAVIVNVILYSAAHIPKGKTETIAAIPFGIVLCVLTLRSGTIWIAFFAHLVNAITTTIITIKYNPEMRYAGTSRESFNT